MSQEKVDYHKQQKANRKELVKKEKRNRVLRLVITIVIIAVALGWFGFAIYLSNKPVEKIMVETDYTAVDTYLDGLTN